MLRKGITMKSKLFAATFTLLVLTLVSCASLRPMPMGATQADVRAALGAPSLQSKTGSGERWAYSTAPEGKLTWMYDCDAAGRMVSRTQALTIDSIARVSNGQTLADVELLIGPSYWSRRYPFRQDEWVQVYRFDDVALPMCFYVGYNAANVVVSTAMQEEIRSSLRMSRPC